LHWFLALALIPLAINIFVPQETPEQLRERIEHSLENAVVDPAALASVSSGEEDDEGPDLFQFLPGHKLHGAFLARDSWLQWGFAFAAAGLYLTFCCFLASDKSANPLHLLGLGLFTATGGICLLLGVQFLATAMPLARFRIRGIIGLLFLLLALIGASYSLANDPDTGLLLSFLGFTAGVGFCEEVCKAIPLLVYYRERNKQSWRGAFLWGLASGVGFGVAEGIMYSQSFYNGVQGWDIYVVRFVSCVALHAVWSGSVGISINQRQEVWQQEHEEGWGAFLGYLLAVLQLVAIPMVLHGLYDTLLKKDMNLAALATAAASFGYLAWQISRLRQDDDVEERAKFVANYIRQRAAAQ
jgi:RsiW-degrading membrane proteinase PrsW (M82 family)